MKTYNVTVNGVTYTVSVEEVDAASTPVAAPVAAPAAASAPAAAPAKKVSAAAGSVVVKAPMPGNIIKVNVKPGDSVKRGDVLAVLTTGAYNYSMASNYNKIPRLPIIMVSRGKDYVAVRRETFEDVARYDV